MLLGCKRSWLLGGTNRYNQEEALEIKKLLIDIASKLTPEKSKEIAVITPCSAQKKLLRKIINDLKDRGQIQNLQIKCDTVDSFQGQEADIVIYSCVRTDGSLSFLIDKKRLNVALSRVRENLFIVGHKDFLYNAKVEGKEIIKKLLNAVHRVCYKHKTQGFWGIILNLSFHYSINDL